MPLGSAPLPADWAGDASHNRTDGEIAGEVANQIVGLLREHTGRGPTKAKCAITSDLVVVTLADCLTTLETQLAAGGDIELVRRVRRAIHDGLHPEATAIVEEFTQRHVVAYLTAQQHDPDLAVLIFYLAQPEPTAS
jgi:uncharacterized protein YbcI